jgi:hypothetical protein
VHRTMLSCIQPYIGRLDGRFAQVIASHCDSPQARRLWVGRRQDCGSGGAAGRSGAGCGACARRRAANGHLMGRFWPQNSPATAPPEVHLQEHHATAQMVTRIAVVPPLPRICPFPCFRCPLKGISARCHAH